jgi:sugar (pentulose or hexulose) kinase
MHTILVTGGASKNRGLLRVLADVFQATILPLSVSNSSALGGSLRAAQAIEGRAWPDLFATFCPPERTLAVTPDAGARSAYDLLATNFTKQLSQI